MILGVWMTSDERRTTASFENTTVGISEGNDASGKEATDHEADTRTY